MQVGRLGEYFLSGWIGEDMGMVRTEDAFLEVCDFILDAIDEVLEV